MERDRDAIEKENIELKKKLAELEAAKPAVVNAENKPIDPGEFPGGMDRDAFKAFFIDWYKKSQGTEPDSLTWARAWKKYNKANENE
jgi:hypothetical protein